MTPDEALLALLPTAGDRIGNLAACVRLGWTSEAYALVRDRLVAQGRLEKGRGRGGTVRRLADPPGGPRATAAILNELRQLTAEIQRDTEALGRWW